MTSDEMLASLAAYHAGEGWAFLPEVLVGTGFDQSRMDAVAFSTFPSLGFRRICYEVKVSRSDFLRDVKVFHKKHAEALRLCSEFVYAAPKGLIKLEELPPEAGLIQRRDDGSLHLTKKAPQRDVGDGRALLASVARRCQRAERLASSQRYGILHEALRQIAELRYDGRLLKPKGPLRHIPPRACDGDIPRPAGWEFLSARYSGKAIAEFANTVMHYLGAVPFAPPLDMVLLAAGERLTCVNGHVVAVALQRIDYGGTSPFHKPDWGELRHSLEWYRASKGIEAPLPSIQCAECGADCVLTTPDGTYFHVEGDWRLGKQP